MKRANPESRSIIEQYRAQVIERMEAAGELHPDCPVCDPFYYWQDPEDGMRYRGVPPHPHHKDAA